MIWKIRCLTRLHTLEIGPRVWLDNRLPVTHGYSQSSQKLGIEIWLSRKIWSLLSEGLDPQE